MLRAANEQAAAMVPTENFERMGPNLETITGTRLSDPARYNTVVDSLMNAMGAYDIMRESGLFPQQNINPLNAPPYDPNWALNQIRGQYSLIPPESQKTKSKNKKKKSTDFSVIDDLLKDLR